MMIVLRFYPVKAVSCAHYAAGHLGWTCAPRYEPFDIPRIDERSMPVDLHYICKRGKNCHFLPEDFFETGNWVAGELLSSLAHGGRIFLHVAQKEPAWYGGTILRHRSAPPPESSRMVFVCRRDFDYKVLCPARWAREKAIARWNDDRTMLMTQVQYMKAIRSKRLDPVSNPL
jgi:hypothetical protein